MEGNYPTALTGPHFKIVRRPKSKKLVVLFSGTGKTDGRFEWWRLSREHLRDNLLLINNGRNEWYQSGVPGLGNSVEETADTIRKWAAALKTPEIYTIGSSMGAHAAILYGVPLGARVLAFGGETVLLKKHSYSSRLLAKGYRPPLPDIKPLLKDARAPIYVWAGEREPLDLIHARHLKGMPMVQVESLRCSDHAVPRYLTGRNRLITLLKRFLRNHPLAAGVDAGAGSMIDGFADAAYAAFCAIKDKDPIGAEKAAREAVELYPGSDYAHFLLGKTLFMQKRFADALPHLGAACGLGPDFVDAHFLFALSVHKLGRLADAAGLHRKLLATWPEFGRSYYDLGLIYAAEDRIPDAIKTISVAAALEPHRREFRKRLSRLRTIARQRKAAEAAGAPAGDRQKTARP
jgi:tetratricopeptide (TPR) repeat protein